MRKPTYRVHVRSDVNVLVGNENPLHARFHAARADRVFPRVQLRIFPPAYGRSLAARKIRSEKINLPLCARLAVNGKQRTASGRKNHIFGNIIGRNDALHDSVRRGETHDAFILERRVNAAVANRQRFYDGIRFAVRKLFGRLPKEPIGRFIVTGNHARFVGRRQICAIFGHGRHGCPAR